MDPDPFFTGQAHAWGVVVLSHPALTALIERERERLEHGDSVLDPYGLSSPAELFAVAVEAFFQDPVAVAARHRDLYAFLASYFNQDPAAWSAGPRAR